jgi:hypothetical protein
MAITMARSELPGQGAGRGVLEAFAARRRHIIGPAPDQHLLFAPLGARIVLVEAAEIAIVAFIERDVPDDREIEDAHFLEHQVQRVLGAAQSRGVVEIGHDALGLECLAGGAGLADALFGQVRIAPAGEEILEVPLAFAMAHEDQGTGHH